MESNQPVQAVLFSGGSWVLSLTRLKWLKVLGGEGNFPPAKRRCKEREGYYFAKWALWESFPRGLAFFSVSDAMRQTDLTSIIISSLPNALLG